MGNSNCLVEVEAWTGIAPVAEKKIFEPMDWVRP